MALGGVQRPGRFQNQGQAVCQGLWTVGKHHSIRECGLGGVVLLETPHSQPHSHRPQCRAVDDLLDSVDLSLTIERTRLSGPISLDASDTELDPLNPTYAASTRRNGDGRIGVHH